MKKVLFALFLICSMNLAAQENFEWDVIKESSKTKEQLYSDAKMFIAEMWKSAQQVIQNDDKEGGLILVKGAYSKSLYYQLNNHDWGFSYTVKLYMKENKFRIVIDNVICDLAQAGTYKWPLMPVADAYPEKGGMKLTGVSEKRYEEIMSSLKEHLQGIVDSYVVYMEKTNNTNDDW